MSGASGFGEGFRSGDGDGDVRVDFGGPSSAGATSAISSRASSAKRPQARGAAARDVGAFDGFSMRGGDQEAVLELTLEEAATGGKRRISLGDGRDFEVEIRGACGTDSASGSRAGRRRASAAGPAGDLFLRVRVKPHPRFRVEGRDLYVDLPSTPWEAAFGAEVPVPTLGGQRAAEGPGGILHGPAAAASRPGTTRVPTAPPATCMRCLRSTCRNA